MNGACARRALVRLLAGLVLLTLSSGDAVATERLPVELTRGWAVQADGRVKPLLTYANETVLSLTGRESFDALSSLEIFWGYVFAAKDFQGRPYLRVDSEELKALLNLPPAEKRFSFATLMNNQVFREVAEEALRRDAEDQELSRVQRDALAAYAKVERVARLIQGTALTVVPVLDESQTWSTPREVKDSANPAARSVYEGFDELAAAYAARDTAGFERAAERITAALRDVDRNVYPAQASLERELFYEDLNAFGKAWKLYLLGFLVVLFVGFSNRPWGYVVGMLILATGFACHSLGIGLRWMIAGRAPVSDMYESLVFMGWGAIALGLLQELFSRKRFYALAAGVIGFLCLAFAEQLPIDSSINPLVPVLAHTSWLAVHVMTIMLSYSALALAMALGHVVIFIQLFQPGRSSLLHSLSALLYRTLQFGLLFLAAGIIFGAIWANESWGRYWGWDPKETWSLITFFVYLAIVHARFAGWLREFGMATCSILGFLSVIMTYYGVNFVLSAGMHSYGFAEGGQIYALLYVIVEIALVGGAFLRYRSALAPAVR